MLTVQERRLLETIWTSGVSALLSDGYTAEQIRDFISREDVQLEIATLEREFKHGGDFEARSKYKTRRGLSQIAPGAVGLLARAVAGPEYARDEQGFILRDARGLPILKQAEPTPAQLRAAQIVVDAVGGKEDKGTDYRGDLQLNMMVTIDTKNVSIEHGQAHLTPEQQALSRERMRNAIDRLMLRLDDVRGRVDQALGVVDVTPKALPEGKPKKKTVRKRKTKQVEGGDA